MIWAPCGTRGAFSLISWLFITKFEQITYQIEAEYLSYSMIFFILLLARDLAIEVVNSAEILTFYLNFFEFAYLS